MNSKVDNYVHSTVSETETIGCNSNNAVSDSLRKEVVIYDEAMNPVNNNNSFKLQENVAYN